MRSRWIHWRCIGPGELGLSLIRSLPSFQHINKGPYQPFYFIAIHASLWHLDKQSKLSKNCFLVPNFSFCWGWGTCSCHNCSRGGNNGASFGTCGGTHGSNICYSYYYEGNPEYDFLNSAFGKEYEYPYICILMFGNLLSKFTKCSMHDEDLKALWGHLYICSKNHFSTIVVFGW